MTRLARILFSISAFFILTSLSYAADVNQTFYLTLINRSNETLIIQSIRTVNGVTLQADRELWRPGSVINIVAENISSNGINARVRFFGDNKKHTVLFLEIREQRHTGQPIIGLNNEYYQSTVLSKTRNTNIGGRYLMYTAATVELRSRIAS